MKKFTFKEVPEGYRLCFNERCKKRDACIRFLAGQHLPKTLMGGPAVYPNALDDDICPYFKQTRVIHAAWGFRNLYKGVASSDAQVLKAKVINYLGGPVSSFAYQHGEKLLTPEQQEQIYQFFKELGYTKSLVFDGFTTIYDFSE